MPKAPPKKEMKKTSLALPMELWRRTKIQALDEQLEFQEVVAKALEAYLSSARKGGGR